MSATTRTRTRTRTRIYRSGDHVILEGLDLLTEERVRRAFWAPLTSSGIPGGYVHETTPERPGTAGPQVCDRLAAMGSTLWSTREGLLELVRREWRRARAAYAAEVRS